MQICLIGDFSGTPDEGMKNISKTIKNNFENRHNTIALNPRDILQPKVISRVKEFEPQIVHYLHGPTIRSLIMLKGLKMILGKKVRVVVSATRPYFSEYSRWAIPFLKPDLILSQSKRFESFFLKKGCRVVFVPNGVDCRKFSVITNDIKKKLRNKLGFPNNKKIILHVGHIKSNRKLEIFKEIQQIQSVQVVIVGGTTESADEKLKKDLLSSGIKIIHKYFEDISIIYKASDLYVFPIHHEVSKLPNTYNQVGAIDLPLSVFEAMACNLPIITTKFGALQRLFNNGGGLDYVDSEKEILELINNYPQDNVSKTRKKVLPYDWERTIEKIESAYKEILH